MAKSAIYSDGFKRLIEKALKKEIELLNSDGPGSIEDCYPIVVEGKVHIEDSGEFMNLRSSLDAKATLILTRDRDGSKIEITYKLVPEGDLEE